MIIDNEHFSSNNKSAEHLWLKKNALRLRNLGVPFDILDDEHRWYIFLTHGEDYLGFPFSISDSEALEMLNLLREFYDEDTHLLVDLKRQLGML